ncbi:MAG TPA: hypothetical protein VD948_11790 [Rhodothermales bacterium]|nr:hypothetical protein [Rhodothermales bacterium]
MNPHLTLLPVALLCLAGARLSYGPGRDSRWYVPAMALLGACCAALFAWGCRKLGSAERVYGYSLAYDAVVWASYYLFPLLTGARPKPMVLMGAALVVVGLICVKVWGE